MAKITLPLLLIAASPLLAQRPSQSQSAMDPLPTVTTQGDTNPESVSDVNAQLIWRRRRLRKTPRWRRQHEASTGALPLAA